MRIGIITHNYPASKYDRQNAGIFVYDFAHALHKLGHKVFVLCPNNGQKKEKDIVTVNYFNWMGKGTKLGSFNPFNPKDILLFFNIFFSGFKASESFCKDNKIDFIISMWAIPAGIFALWANLKRKIPYCIWALGSDIYVFMKYPIIKSIIKLALKKSTFLIADGLDLAKKTSKIANKKCYFLPSASKMPKYSQNYIRKNNNCVKFAFLGRMELVKGTDILIDAFLKLSNLKFELHCMGDGSLLPILKQKVIDNGLDQKIIFYGNVFDSQKIMKVLTSSDWVVIPSRSDSIPLVFSESMKAGCPVLVSSVGDLPALIKKYNVGLSFPKEDVNNLAKILKNIILKKNIKNIYQKNTKETAKIFDINFSAKEIILKINNSQI